MKIYSTIIAFFILRIVSAQKVWSFNDCLTYAKENNLQVLASVLNEKIQESNYNISKRDQLPDLKGTVGNNFTFGPEATSNISYTLNQYGVPTNFDINSSYKYNEGYQNSLALESSIILYSNGKLRINQEKNKFLIDQYKFTTEKIRNDISLQLVGNYLTVLLNKELMLVDGNSLDTQLQDTERNEKLYNAGSIPLSTLYESKSNLASSKQSYENSKIEVNRALMNLAMLLQKDYRDFEIEDVKVSDNIDLPLINLDDIINYAYNNQPEIKSAELGIEAAKKDIDLARTELYPTITGGYKASTYYQDYFDRSVKNLEDQWYDNHSQMLTIGVNIPIFNKGISKIKIEQSKVSQLVKENELDQEKLNLKQTIQSSYFDVNSSYQTFNSAKELVRSTHLSYEYAQKSFNAGKINVYDLNIARNNYFNAQSQMLQAKYSFLFRLKILEFYMGKPLEITSDEGIGSNTLTPSISQTVYNMENTSANQNLKTIEEKVENELNNITEITDFDDNLKAATAESALEGNNLIPKEGSIKVNLNPENIKEEAINVDNLKTQSKEIQSKNIDTASPVNTEKKNENNIEEKKKSISSDNSKVPSKEIQNSNIDKTTPIKTKEKNEDELKREALIRERREKLMQGSSKNEFKNEAEREALIKQRRAELNKK